MASLRLEIVTPDRVVLGTDVDYVGAPGVDGEFGVLAGHIPLITALNIGSLYYRIDGKTYWVFVAGGFVEVADNKVTVLAESAHAIEETDAIGAEQARKHVAEHMTAQKA